MASVTFALVVCIWVVGLSLFLGKDLNWDFLNYHFYGPYLLLEDRLAKDYFAASIQSYLNPLAHVPHYLMIRAGWNSLAIAVVLALFHSLNLYFVWRIAKAVLPAGDTGLSMLAIALALLAPLFITTAGSSFADPSTSVLLLAGMWCLLKTFQAQWPATGTLLAAGLLLGVSGGLKLTNGVLAVAVVLPAVAYWAWTRPSAWLTRVALLAGGLLVGLLVGHGYWSWKLWQAFGNPVFPLLNHIFQSPDFPAISFRDTRFLGEGWRGLLTLPFLMPMPISWLYAENVAVDLRPAVLVFVMIAALGASALFRFRRSNLSAGRTSIPAPLIMLTAMVLLSYLMWGLTSKIGRYALPVWLLLGPLIVAWSCQLFVRKDLVLTLGLIVVGAQSYALLDAGTPRWSPSELEDKWLKVQVPDELARQPMTVLTLGKQSYAAIVPFLHPDSRVVNLAGQYIQPAGSNIRPRLKALLDTPIHDMRVVFTDRVPGPGYGGRPPKHAGDDLDAVLSTYGLRLSANACSPIVLSTPYQYSDADIVASQTGKRPPLRKSERLHACQLARLTAAELAATNAEREKVSLAFNAIEAACVSAFNPVGGESLRGGRGWMRTYFNSLNSLMTDGQVVFARPFYSMVDVSLGPLDAWTRQPVPACPRIPNSINRPD